MGSIFDHFADKTANVLDFWDGRTDDEGLKRIRPALRDANIYIKSNGGGVVWFPAGEYTLEEPNDG